MAKEPRVVSGLEPEHKEPRLVSGLEPEPAAPAIVKECPKCKASIWQGPHYRGTIVGLVLVPSEELYTCVNCHATMPITDMADRASLAGTI